MSLWKYTRNRYFQGPIEIGKLHQALDKKQRSREGGPDIRNGLAMTRFEKFLVAHLVRDWLAETEWQAIKKDVASGLCYLISLDIL